MQMPQTTRHLACSLSALESYVLKKRHDEIKVEKKIETDKEREIGGGSLGS
jgi:hypothetical protein